YGQGRADRDQGRAGRLADALAGPAAPPGLVAGPQGHDGRAALLRDLRHGAGDREDRSAGSRPLSAIRRLPNRYAPPQEPAATRQRRQRWTCPAAPWAPTRPPTGSSSKPKRARRKPATT